MTGRRPSPSPPSLASPPDDLLHEIFLRLPPHPTALLRAALVCRRWRRLLADPEFLRRLRARHRGVPPVLGYFHNSVEHPTFVPVQDPPDRVAPERFSLGDHHRLFLDCRHGRVVLLSKFSADLLVWDPVTGDRRHIALPPVGGNTTYNMVDVHAAVVCAADGDHRAHHVDCHARPFRVAAVLVRKGRALTGVYSSQTGAWGELTSSRIPFGVRWLPPALVGNTLYWLLSRIYILGYELEAPNLVFVEQPQDWIGIDESNLQVMKADDGVLGVATVTECNLTLWAREMDGDGVGRWVRRKTIEVDAFIPLPTAPLPVQIIGIAEDGNVVFVWTMAGIFMVYLETMRFKKVFATSFIHAVYPYTSFCIAGCYHGASQASVLPPSPPATPPIQPQIQSNSYQLGPTMSSEVPTTSDNDLKTFMEAQVSKIMEQLAELGHTQASLATRLQALELLTGHDSRPSLPTSASAAVGETGVLPTPAFSSMLPAHPMLGPPPAMLLHS